MTTTREQQTAPETTAATRPARARRERDRIDRYDPPEIEHRWQAKWEEIGLHRTDLHDASRHKLYLLTMYPYPPRALHIGHRSIASHPDLHGCTRHMHGDNL